MNINIQRLERMRLRGSGATKERESDARSLEKKYKNNELIMIMMIVFILEYVKGAKLGREIGAAAARLAGGKVGLKVLNHL